MRPLKILQTRGGCLVGPLAALAIALQVGAAELGSRIDFNFHIRPLLSDRCFRCHGPDASARKAGLRLDTLEGALGELKRSPGDHAIVPGNPEQSILLQRINSTDHDEVMPPADSLLSLSPDEKELLRRWIAEGAEYKAHWAFLPVSEVVTPTTDDKAWARNAIDAFVLAKLDEASLTPSPQTPRESLVRRVTFDLTGLPPSLEEIDRFLGDDSPDACERLVDRLLASPAYGERRALDWLDLARYADTYGYQSDVERDMSPWRDWVVNAFNANLPYDDFIRWQVAGDLLPQASRDQVLATAFHRLHRQTNEGGSIDEEFRVEYVADRVHTTGTAFLGLTMECARCHDHKFDPIAQRDYYRFFAFFDKIDESGLYSHFTQATPAPTLYLYGEGAEAKHLQLKHEITGLEKRLETERRATTERFQAWQASGGTLAPPKPVAAFAFDEEKSGASPNAVDPTRAAKLVEGATLAAGQQGQAVSFSGDNSVVCKGVGSFRRTTPFSISLWLRLGEAQERAVVLHRSRAWSDSGSRGYEVVLESSVPTFALIHFWPGNAIKVKARRALAVGAWSHWTFTYDGSSRASGLKIYRDGAAEPLDVVRDNLYRDIEHRGEWGDGDVGGVELTLAGRFRDNGLKNGLVDDLQIFDRALTPGELRQVAGRNDAPTAAELLAYFVDVVDEPCRSLARELQALREQEDKLASGVREIMVLREMSVPRQTRVLRRGAYHSPGEAVEAGTPDRIFPLAEGLPRNRLGLATWLTDANNPLVARVAVNRVWRTFFGRGLVVTEEDFGSQGDLPTHPELLDALARHFVGSAWNLKALHRLIATSAAYQQSSRADPASVARDPDNRLLSRGPTARLAAEEIRDNALAVSGLLSRRLGGRSVRPYQPAGVWEEAGTGKSYAQDHGEKLYRRSFYTFWRRTAPPPSMLTFDAGSREVCVARREATSTPLQALVLLNDPQVLEAARALAEILLRESPQLDLEARIVKGFRLATGRHPEAEERRILKRLYAEELARLRAHPADAEKYLKIGERPADARLPQDELAATTVLTSALMNLDEFVTKR